jgi:hypothetical protein
MWPEYILLAWGQEFSIPTTVDTITTQTKCSLTLA